jgi:hypothetical protein
MTGVGAVTRLSFTRFKAHADLSVGNEPMTTAFERKKTVHAFARVAALTSSECSYRTHTHKYIYWHVGTNFAVARSV